METITRPDSQQTLQDSDVVHWQDCHKPHLAVCGVELTGEQTDREINCVVCNDLVPDGFCQCPDDCYCMMWHLD